MSQFGMAMPGGHMHRAASMNVYTGLLALAFVSLLAACFYIAFEAGPKVGPDGDAFTIHPKDGDLKLQGVPGPGGR